MTTTEDTKRSTADHPLRRVAITGVAIACAAGTDTDAAWKAIREGGNGIRLVRRLDVSSLRCHYAGEVDQVPLPHRRPRGQVDRATRLALTASAQALESADLDPGSVDTYRAGVALGTSVGGLELGERFHWERLRGEPGKRAHLLGYPLYTSTDAVSITFGLRGPTTVVSNACAAGANAIGFAADAVRDGRADLMLAGGVDVLDILSLAGFNSLRALDDRPCSPYSRSSGLNIGEGAGVLVLEPEEAATSRGAAILGYLRGYALSSDAHHATAPDPSGGGAGRAMRAALAQAELTAESVDYVNGHGTGTPANDSAETKAVDQLFGTDVPRSSTKSQVGHMLGAAGALEAAVSVLALRDQVLPPTVNVDPEHPSERDIVPDHGRAARVDTIMSNSFAFGGNNCAVVLGRDPGPRQRASSRRVVVTGTGAVTPLGVGRDELIAALAAGTVAVGPSESVDTSQSTTHMAAELDPATYRTLVNPSYARRLDQLGMLVMAASRLALTDSGLNTTRTGPEQVGLICGTCTGPLETVAALSETIGTVGPDRVNPRLFPNSVMNAAAGHACLALGLKGPLSTLASGCAAGVTALGYSADLIRRGEAEAMLAVSADELSSLLHLGFDRLGVLSGTGARPYGQDRDGCVLGAGGAALMLESEEHARERGAPILAEVRGHAVTSDAYRIAGNDPSGEAWAESLRLAAVDAGLSTDDIAAVYGDARGTEAIDLAEARAITRLWNPGQVRVAALAGQLGHLHSTTPLLSAISALETVSNGWTPEVATDSPVPEIAPYLDAEPDAAGRPCLVTSANWGGTYASVVLAPYSEGIR